MSRYHVVKAASVVWLAGKDDIMARWTASLFVLHLIFAGAVLAQETAALRAQEGASALLRGRFEQAIALYDEALKGKDLGPARLASMYNDRGVAKWRLERLEDALADFNKAIEIYPQYASLYNNRGNVLFDLEKTDQALRDFNKAIELLPGYGVAYNNRGNVLHELGRNEEAVEDFKRAIAIMPGNAVPYNGRGKAQGMLGRPYTALRYLSRALTLNGKYPAAYRNRAAIHLHLERFEEAIEDYNKVIALSPEDAELYVRRGQAWARSGKSQSAERDFSKAIEIDPENALAYAERGALANKRGQHDAALTDLNQALALDPSLIDARYNRALAYVRLDQAEQAKPDIATILKAEPRFADVYLLRGEMLEAEGQVEAALDDYRKAVQFDPFMDAAREAIKRISGEEAEGLIPRIGEPVSGWSIISPAPGRFVAIHDTMPKIRVVLEMHGEGKPEILEWTPLKDTLAGIGLLRYYAGTDKAGRRYEHVVILDTQRNQIVSIEPYIWGEQKARWDWTDIALTVTDPEGVISAYQLRKPKPPPRPRVVEESPWGGFGWSEPRRYRGQPRNVFEWLFR
jgi:tetratricopeptide (TPR) repeat protein